MKRVVVRMFLPIDMAAAAKVMSAVAEAFPDASLASSSDDPTIVDLVTEVRDPIPAIESEQVPA